MHISAILLCAGFGKRLRPLTKTIPKPLLKYKNRTLLSHNLLKLFSIGIKKFFINAYYLSSKIRDYVQDIWGAEIVFSEELEILGTGGGVYSFRDFIESEFFIINNTDIYHEIDLEKAIEFHIKNNAFATLIVKDDYENKVLIESFHIIDFSKEVKEDAYTFTGISIVSRGIFDYLEYRCSLIDGLKRAINHNKSVLAYITNEEWKDALKLDFSR